MQNNSTKAPLMVSVYQLLIFCASCLQSVFLLAMRVIWGWQFFGTGKGKLENLDRVAGYFATLHIPMPKLNAFMAGSAECFGGLLIVLGLGSRLAAIPLTITMIVAYATAEWPDIHNFDDFVKATPFPFLLTVLLVLFFGPGRASVDYLLEKTVFAQYRSSDELPR